VNPREEKPPSKEPTPEEQARYWELALELGELKYRGDTEGEAAALKRLKDFAKEHEGKQFRAFDPENVTQAFNDVLEPLGLDNPKYQNSRRVCPLCGQEVSPASDKRRAP